MATTQVGYLPSVTLFSNRKFYYFWDNSSNQRRIHIRKCKCALKASQLHCSIAGAYRRRFRFEQELSRLQREYSSKYSSVSCLPIVENTAYLGNRDCKNLTTKTGVQLHNLSVEHSSSLDYNNNQTNGVYWPDSKSVESRSVFNASELSLNEWEKNSVSNELEGHESSGTREHLALSSQLLTAIQVGKNRKDIEWAYLRNRNSQDSSVVYRIPVEGNIVESVASEVTLEDMNTVSRNTETTIPSRKTSSWILVFQRKTKKVLDFLHRLMASLWNILQWIVHSFQNYLAKSMEQSSFEKKNIIFYERITIFLSVHL